MEEEATDQYERIDHSRVSHSHLSTTGRWLSPVKDEETLDSVLISIGSESGKTLTFLDEEPTNPIGVEDKVSTMSFRISNDGE